MEVRSKCNETKVRLLEVERTNRVLLEKITSIISRSGVSLNPSRKLLLHESYRKKLQQEILNDNYVFLAQP